MANTTYTDYVAPTVNAEWLNEVNDHVWSDTPVSGTTVHNSSLIGFTQAGGGAVARTVQNKMRDFVSVKDFGAVGDGVADDTIALTNFFTAVAAGKRGKMPEGVYLYNRSTSAALSASCTKFVLEAKGAVIRCSGYPSLGTATVADFIKIRATEIHLDGLTVDGGWNTLGSRVDSYGYNLGAFSYMHGLAISADSGFIDNITIHDVEGIGFTTEHALGGLSGVQIGKITTHHNWMIGVDFRSTASYVQNVTVGQLIAYNNGTRGTGWVSVNFGDVKAAAGTNGIQVGSILSYSGGGSGVGIGQYASIAGGDVSGAKNVSIGQVTTHNNAGAGIEIYASWNTQIGSINAYSNTGKGVYFERSDTSDIFGYVGQIGSISANNNSQDGVLISGWSNLDIDSIVSWNNGQGGANYSGVVLYAASLGGGLTETGHIGIGSIRAFDDQGASNTQSYGLLVSYYGAPKAFTSIGSVDLYSNKTKDLAWNVYGNCRTLSINELSYGSIQPTYADNHRILLAINGTYQQKWQTTDAVAIAPLIILPARGLDCIIEATAVGRDSGGTVLHYNKEVSAYKWTGTGWARQNQMQALTHKTSTTNSYTLESGTGIGVFVSGVAATTIDWDVTIKSSTPIDRDFSA